MLNRSKSLLTRSLSVLNLMALAAAPASPELLAAENSQALTEPLPEKNGSASASLEPIEEAAEPSICEKCSKPMKVFYFQRKSGKDSSEQWVCSACLLDDQPAVKKARFVPIDRDDEQEHEDYEVELTKARSLAEDSQKELAKMKLELYQEKRQHKEDAENAKTIITNLEQRVSLLEKERDSAIRSVGHKEKLVEKATAIIAELSKVVNKEEKGPAPVVCNCCKNIVYGAQQISFCGDCRSEKEKEEEKLAQKNRVKAVGLLKRDLASQWQALKEQVENRLGTMFYEMAGEEV